MRWKNPVYSGYFADPFVWKYQGRYYAVGTGPINEKASAGEAEFTTYMIDGREMAIPLLVSDNLTTWKLHGGASGRHSIGCRQTNCDEATGRTNKDCAPSSLRVATIPGEPDDVRKSL